MLSIGLRGLGVDDRDSMLAMYADFEPLLGSQGLPPARENERTVWIDRLLGEAWNIGGFTRDGKLVGHGILVASGAGESEIAFFVHQKYRQQRIGTRLVKSMLERARERDVKRIWASTGADNVPALRLLHRCGFGMRRFQPPTVEMELSLSPREGDDKRSVPGAAVYV